MKISIFKDKLNMSGVAQEVLDINEEELESYVCNNNWSPSIFRRVAYEDKQGKVRIGMKRESIYFEYCDSLVLDVDDGCSLEEAREKFKGYKAVFLTTRNHQKIKNKGKSNERQACDRFRVIIPLSEPIKDQGTYRATWLSAFQIWPFIDKSCKDPARFYLKSVAQVMSLKGKAFDVVTARKEPKSKGEKAKTDAKGALCQRTINFIINGVIIENWHDEFVRAASDMRISGFSIIEAEKMLAMASFKYDGTLDETDLLQLKDIYSREKVYQYSETRNKIKWDKPIPMRLFNVPEIDPNLFPKVISDFIKAESVFSETPVALSGMAVLGAVSVALSGKFFVEPKVGYQESLNLYLMTALESGNRKTSVLKSAMFPLEVWEENKEAEIEPQIKKATYDKKCQEAEIKNLKLKIKKTKDEAKKIELEKEVDDLLANEIEIPVLPRLIASDITPERLATLMAEQGERIGIVSDEGGIFDLIGGRYNSGVANLDLFLKGYDGSPCRVDRQSKDIPSVKLRKPFITTMVSPQPSVIQSLSSKSDFRDRGLVARFLIALPESPIGSRSGTKEYGSKEVREKYNKCIEKLLTIEVPSDPWLWVERTIRFTESASKLWFKLWKRTEAKMSDDGILYYIKDWGSKLPGKVARIAALFQIVELVGKELKNIEITGEVMEKAIGLAEQLEPHALKAFDLMSSDSNYNSALTIYNWLKRKRYLKFTQRQCHKELQSRFRKSNDVARALAVLEEKHIIQKLDEGVKAYRPSNTYEVNPYIYGGEDDSLFN